MQESTPLVDRTATEHHFTSHDGQVIFYRHWQAVAENKQNRAIVLLHRGHEHSGRLAHIVIELGLPDTPFFAWDARGNGRTAGPRGYSPSFATMVQDLETFIKHISLHYHLPEENIVVIAQSVGAVTAVTWVHDLCSQNQGADSGVARFRGEAVHPLCSGRYCLVAETSRTIFYSILCEG